MKHLTAVLSLLCCSLLPAPAAAGTPPDTDTLGQGLVGLAAQGQAMDLREVGKALGLPDLYGRTLFKGSDDKLLALYEVPDPAHPVRHIRHTVWLDMRSGFNATVGHMELTFKKGRCLNVKALEQAIGGRAQTMHIPNPPDLLTGRGSSYERVFLHLGGEILSIRPDGCEASLSSRAVFGKEK